MRFLPTSMRGRCGAALVAVVLAVTLAWAEVDVDRMHRFITDQYGSRGEQNYRDWRELIAQSADQPEADKLARVNDFFDRRIRYATDMAVWHVVDYWATPLEALGQGAGDCEDYVIAKYFSLIEMGVDRGKLRWIYVQATVANSRNPAPQAHMVLGYYATPGAEPLVLDNLITSILPASRRPDLVPVFSFNTEGIWRPGAATVSGSINQLSMWRDLMRKMKEEGYEP